MGTHYISVGHRSSILDYHNLVLELQTENRWRLMPVNEYRQTVLSA